MELKRLKTEQLESLLHHICEAESILNYKDLKLTELDYESDKAIIELKLMSVAIFDEIKLRSNPRHQQAKERLINLLMQEETDMSHDEASDYIDEVVVSLRNAKSLDDAYEIWEIEFNTETDDLNDLMGW